MRKTNLLLYCPFIQTISTNVPSVCIPSPCPTYLTLQNQLLMPPSCRRVFRMTNQVVVRLVRPRSFIYRKVVFKKGITFVILYDMSFSHNIGYIIIVWGLVKCVPLKLVHEQKS